MKKADVVETHTGRKAPGFEMHARAERRLAVEELENLQSVIALLFFFFFLHIVKDESGNAFVLQKGGSTWSIHTEEKYF